MPIETVRQKLFFRSLLDLRSGVRKIQEPSTLGPQKITLSMPINERRQDPPQKKNPDKCNEPCPLSLQSVSLSFRTQRRLKESWHGERQRETEPVYICKPPRTVWSVPPTQG